MELTLINFIELGVSALITVMVGSLWHFMSKSVKRQAEAMRLAKERQEESERRASEFRRSMQRAELIRYFRIVVEQGNPITPEELSHIDSTYESYHGENGNGTGTFMYEKIMEYVKLITTAGGSNGSQNRAD